MGMKDRASRDAAAGKTLQCTEVWGGNWQVDQAVVLPGLDAWVYSQPSGHEAVGGDVHYVSACAGGRVGRVLLAEVSGHGAIVGATADALRRLMRRLVNDHDQLRLVRNLNREFTAGAAKATAAGLAPFRFATAVALTFDSYTGRLLACNAGHPPPLWYRVAERRWTTLESQAPGGAGGNVPVGVVAGFDFRQFELKLDVGDLVLCFTDSLTEARDAAGNDLGIPGLLDLVRSVDGSADISRLVPAVLSMLDRLDSKNLTRDDLTCLLMRVTGARPLVPLVDRLLSPFRAAAGLAGVHLPSTRRDRRG